MKPNFFLDDEAIANQYLKEINVIGFACVGLALSLITIPHPQNAAWFAFAVATLYAFSQADQNRKFVRRYLLRYPGSAVPSA